MSDSQPLGELGAFRRGRGGTKADEASSGIPCIRYGDLYTQHDCVIRNFTSFIDRRAAHKYTPLRKGDVVFAASGELHEDIGKAAVFLGDEEAYTGGDTIVFHPSHGVDPLFLGYAVNSEQAARFKAKSGQGSSVIHIKSSNLKELRVLLPPLPEQRRIAEILDTVDEAIQRTEELIAKLEEMKKGLLHDLLTRGIDENGELRDPERHPEQFKDSPLGRIPRAWEVRTAREVFHAIKVGIVVRPTQYYAEAGVPVLRSANVREDGLDLSEVEYMTPEAHVKMASTQVTPGDLVTVRTGYPGTTAVIPDSLPSANCVDIIISRPGPDENPYFLAAWVNSDQGKGQVLRSQGGLAQQHFNVGEMRNLLIPLPTQREQRRIVDFRTGLSRRIQCEQDSATKLHSLRQALMDDLLTGRVRVTVPDPGEATA